VCSVGPGRVLDNGTRAPLDIKVGDTVLFAKYSGTEFKLDDDDLLIFSERDILAVIENGT
jgi:chaperonin GroES